MPDSCCHAHQVKACPDGTTAFYTFWEGITEAPKCHIAQLWNDLLLTNVIHFARKGLPTPKLVWAIAGAAFGAAGAAPEERMLVKYGALGVKLACSMKVAAGKGSFTAYVFQADVRKAEKQLQDNHALACVVAALDKIQRVRPGYSTERRRSMSDLFGVSLPRS